MQFHEYRTIRNQLLATKNLYPQYTKTIEATKKFSSAEYREMWIDIIRKGTIDNESDAHTALAVLSEDLWVDELRPYYNVWPIAVELAQTVKLSLTFKSLSIPFDALLLRFASGHEPLNIVTALLSWPHDQTVIHIAAYTGPEWHKISLKYVFDPEQQVEDWLDDARSNFERSGDRFHSGDTTSVPELLIRLCVFIALLANDHDFITPIVLAKDRQKYESTDDPDIKRWLENKAARRAGRGFEVGKQLQVEKEKSTHWRNPHLCLFWTGPGRKKPIIQMRSGSVVQKVSMAIVPTGYLGPETEADDQILSIKTPRESISKTRRFEILKRDNYQCQLCGRTADDGVKLHVDHRVSLNKGGSNEDDNLWTLCEQCNLGKSDKPL